MNRYQPKKLKSPVKAIREFCIECMGGRDSEGNAKHISECQVPVCALFEIRFGKNPFNTKNLSEEERKRRAVRLKNAVLDNKTSKNSPEFCL